MPGMVCGSGHGGGAARRHDPWIPGGVGVGLLGWLPAWVDTLCCGSEWLGGDCGRARAISSISVGNSGTLYCAGSGVSASACCGSGSSGIFAGTSSVEAVAVGTVAGLCCAVSGVSASA